MGWTKDIPIVSGWYWVMWHGYEYPEVVLVTQRELEIYACGEKYTINYEQVSWWSKQPIDNPEAMF